MNPAETPFSGVMASAAGVLRAVMIIGLVLLAIPAQTLVLLLHRGDPFVVPRLVHAGLLRILGIRVRVHGRAVAEGPVLYVANHTSYLDVLVLGSLVRAVFVAKADVENWPVFGLLAKLQQTAFVERRAVQARSQRDSLQQRLLQGQNLVFFPEGTSTEGWHILPFKSSLFSLAELEEPSGRPVTVQPITLRCAEIAGLPVGRLWRPYYSWFGRMTLLPHLWRVLKEGQFTVDAVFHAPVTLKDFPDRKALAVYCRDVIARAAGGQPAAFLSPDKKQLAQS